MTTNVGEIRARITVETADFKKQMEDARRKISELESQSKRSADGFRGMGGALAGIGAGAGLTKLVREMMSAVDASTKLYNSFMGLNAVAKGFGVQTKDAQQAAQDLAQRGFLTLTQAVTAYKTALSTGLGLGESTKLINSLADSAAYNRQSFYTMGEAVQASLDGIKNGNSVLSDAVGITKNLSVMQSEYAKSIGTTAGKLTEAQKIQAAYNGFIREGAIFAGNADRAMQGYAGSQARFEQATNAASVALGEAFTPAVQSVLDTLTPLIIGLADFVSENKALVAGLATGTAGVLAFITVLAGAATLLKTLPAILGAVKTAAAFLGIATGPFGIAITVVGALAAAFGALKSAKAADKKATEDSIAAQKELNALLEKSPINRTASDIETLKAKTEELNPVLQDRARLQERLNEIEALQSRGEGTPALLSEAIEISEALADVDAKLKGLGYSGVEQATAKLGEMNAVIKQGVIGLSDQDKAEAQALATKKQTLKEMSAYAAEFKTLNSAQELDASQQRRLVDITEKLIAQYPELNAQQGEDGRIRASNIDTILSQIDTDKRFTDAAAAQVTARINNLKSEAEAQAKSVQAQIDNYTKLLAAMGKVSGARADTFAESVAQGAARKSGETPSVSSIVFGGYVTSQIEKERDEALRQQQKYSDTARELEKIAAEVANGIVEFDSDMITPDPDKPKKETGKTPAELAAEARKAAYEADLKTVQYVSEYYNLTADAQIKKYDELKKKHAQFLKESVDDARSLTLQLKSLAAESDQDRYDASSEFIDAEIRRMENAGKTEREVANQRTYLWTKLRDKYGKDTEFYKAADEAIYQARKDLNAATAAEEKALYEARKDLAEKAADLAEDLVKAEKDAISDAKKADLDAIDKRKKDYLAAQKEKIDAIDELMAKEQQQYSDADYATELAEKNARIDELASAVGPEGIAEREQAIEERDRMVLEYSRELRTRELEAQKTALEKERDTQESAFDAERDRTERQYDALLDTFETYSTDVKALEAGVQAFRVSEAASANATILSDLDTFLTQYKAKMSELSSAQKAADLAEYNANKNQWAAAKSAGDTSEMARLAARNQELRDIYGITSDSGQKLQSFADGGIIAGLRGAAVTVQAHAGEIVLNPQQQAELWRMIAAPKAVSNEPAAPVYVTNEIDMSVNDVTLGDKLDVAALYDERQRAFSRIQATGVKTF
ncbi:hypothetical protein [Paenibacillus tengchongensis]|uniref:hypothetical protein n=1 Tax=Paenibacillus tengchongensis TaxID=2608684 RepID=UPI00124D9063|nr:hypothetical protein [Paenibacillus tengchongensis]